MPMIFQIRITLLTTLATLLLCLPVSGAHAKPPLLLAEEYQGGIDISRYWVSEKLDGVRAYWDGKQLLSRQGNVFAAPAWFTRSLPSLPLDGELWIARGRYSETVSIVSRKEPHQGWRNIKYMLFELPHGKGSFTRRLQRLEELVAQVAAPHLRLIPQYRLENVRQMQEKLQQIVGQGGEGLMLHLADSRYHHGRSPALLKVKQVDYNEATVIGYRPGKGKYRGMVGSLQVRMKDGTVFHLGSGLTDQQRQTPPPIGTVVRFMHRGWTRPVKCKPLCPAGSRRGKPRFPVLWRDRRDG